MTIAGLADTLPPALVVKAALGLLALEALLLGALALRRGDRVALGGTLFALAPGACLLFAVLQALGPRPWPGVVIALAAALPLHLLDLAWRRRTPPP